jgi:hypothetical protein
MLQATTYSTFQASACLSNNEAVCFRGGEGAPVWLTPAILDGRMMMKMMVRRGNFQLNAGSKP